MYVKNCQKLSKDVKNCQKLSKIVKKCLIMCSCNIWMPQSKTKLLFVDHVYECHPEAKDNLNFEESKEDILIKRLQGISTLDFLTPDFSTMNSITMNSSTMNSSTMNSSTMNSSTTNFSTIISSTMYIIIWTLQP